jgi:hypothetical protein
MKKTMDIDIDMWIKSGKDMNFIKKAIIESKKNHEGSCDEAHPEMTHEEWVKEGDEY